MIPILNPMDILWFLFFLNNSYQHILAILHRFWFSHVSPFLRLAYLIFTSGSTGKPKAIQRDCGVEKTRSREESFLCGFCGISRKGHAFRMEWIHGMLKKILWTRSKGWWKTRVIWRNSWFSFWILVGVWLDLGINDLWSPISHVFFCARQWWFGTSPRWMWRAFGPNMPLVWGTSAEHMAKKLDVWGVFWWNYIEVRVKLMRW